MRYSTPVAAAALIILCCLPSSCGRRVQIDSNTSLSDIQRLVSDEQLASMRARLDQHCGRLEAAFDADDRMAHAREMLALLAYSRSLPRRPGRCPRNRDAAKRESERGLFANEQPQLVKRMAASSRIWEYPQVEFVSKRRLKDCS